MFERTQGQSRYTSRERESSTKLNSPNTEAKAIVRITPTQGQWAQDKKKISTPQKTKEIDFKQDKTKTDYQIQSPGQDDSTLDNRGEEIQIDSMIKAKRAARDPSLQEKQQAWEDI